MKFTLSVPDIISDITVSEQITELITKTSASLAQSGTILVSDGTGQYDLYQLNGLTASLLHSISASAPLSIDRSNPLHPIVKIQTVIPIVSGGIGTGSLTPGTLLIADTSNSFKILSGSNATPNYAIIWDTGSNSYVMGKGGIDVEPTSEGEVLISSGSKYVSKRLTAGANIDLQFNSGSVTITASVPTAILNISASTNLVKTGTSQYPTMSLTNEINLNAVTASHLFATTASIGILNYVNQNQLTIGDKYIVIMSGATDHQNLSGSGIQWGSGSSGVSYDDLGSHAHIRFDGGVGRDGLEIWPRALTEHLTASNISSSYIESGYFSGSYYGDGSQLSGVVAASVEGGAKYALTGSSNIFTTDQTITGSLYISSNISASNYQGDGSQLYITASQITSLREQVLTYITGSGSVTVWDGTASLNENTSVSTLTASTHVSAAYFYGDGTNLTGILKEIQTSGNLTGSGTTTNPAKLKDSIELTGDVTASYITASNITASNIVKASYLYGNGENITSLDLSHVSGVLTTDHGGTGLSSFTTGALYIATSTSTLAPFTGSDFQLIAWDSSNGKWNPYSQPYDVAGEISGSYTSGSTVLSFKIPRNMTFTGVVASVPNFVYRINGTDFIPSSNTTASANDILSVVASSGSANQYFTLLGQLR